MSNNKLKDGFSNITETKKTIWRADQFGKRVVESENTYIIYKFLDNGTYPSSYNKTNEKHKKLKKELIRRIHLFYKSGKAYKSSIRKTIKKKKGKNITNKLEKLNAKKLEKLYKSLLNKKTRKTRK
jgi:hypothetical protein